MLGLVLQAVLVSIAVIRDQISRRMRKLTAKGHDGATQFYWDLWHSLQPAFGHYCDAYISHGAATISNVEAVDCHLRTGCITTVVALETNLRPVKVIINLSILPR